MLTNGETPARRDPDKENEERWGKEPWESEDGEKRKGAKNSEKEQPIAFWGLNFLACFLPGFLTILRVFGSWRPCVKVFLGSRSKKTPFFV